MNQEQKAIKEDRQQTFIEKTEDVFFSSLVTLIEEHVNNLNEQALKQLAKSTIQAILYGVSVIKMVNAKGQGSETVN